MQVNDTGYIQPLYAGAARGCIYEAGNRKN
jgi:hypothetical protein